MCESLSWILAWSESQASWICDIVQRGHTGLVRVSDVGFGHE